MGQHNTSSGDFSITQARWELRDLFQPRLAIYWTDFLVTYGLGMFCFQQVRGGPLWVPHQGWTGTWSQAAYFLASCLLFYRAALFIHELVHQRDDRMRGFRLAWTLLCGIPFLTPLFVYYPHIDHHRRSHYGTEHDGEYLALSHCSPWFLLVYLSWSFVIPVLAVVRFLVLTPLAWLVPGARSWIHARCSTMVMDPSYIRPLPGPRVMREIQWQEGACFAWCLGVALVPPLVLGYSPVPFITHAYLMGVTIVFINSIRTMGAHRWTNREGEMTYLEQLLDSVNYPYRAWITELWGPVGTRYHALHHLFPSLPYHALPEAHRRLVRHLPADSPYLETTEVSLVVAIGKLVWRTLQPASVLPERAWVTPSESRPSGWVALPTSAQQRRNQTRSDSSAS